MIKNKLPKISVIVPFYNAEKCLKRCVDSVLSQTYSNIEVILVNDGSIDESSTICAKFTDMDSRVIYLEQVNQGVSVARNLGIEKANGEFITFLDSDDYLEHHAIATMARLINESKADVVRTKWNEVRDGALKLGLEWVPSGLYLESEMQELLYRLVTGELKSFSPLLIMRKSFLVSNRIYFPQAISMMEDTCFYADVLDTARSIYISNEVTYNYVLHNESASRAIDGFKDRIESIIKVNKYIAKKDLSKAQRHCVNATHVSIISNMLMARIGSVLDVKGVSNLLSITHENKDVRRLYVQSDLHSLDIYHRIETIAVMRRNRIVLHGLKLMRMVAGR